MLYTTILCSLAAHCRVKERACIQKDRFLCLGVPVHSVLTSALPMIMAHAPHRHRCMHIAEWYGASHKPANLAQSVHKEEVCRGSP